MDSAGFLVLFDCLTLFLSDAARFAFDFCRKTVAHCSIHGIIRAQERAVRFNFMQCCGLRALCLYLPRTQKLDNGMKSVWKHPPSFLWRVFFWILWEKLYLEDKR